MVTAAPQDQWRLIDVQDHDTRLAQLAHRRRTLPQEAQLQQAENKLAQVGDELVTARSAAGDVSRELTRAENDVELVRTRATRDQARLDAGQAGAKDLQALQHEIASLAQRQLVLEDTALEVMERLETASGRVTEIEAEKATLGAERDELIRARDAALAQIDAEAAEVGRQRADAAAGLPADLMALYEKVRSGASGIGAARLRARRCEGCRMELNPVDLNRIRVAEPNVVLRCEECGCILVRTPDSGL